MWLLYSMLFYCLKLKLDAMLKPHTLCLQNKQQLHSFTTDLQSRAPKVTLTWRTAKSTCLTGGAAAEGRISTVSWGHQTLFTQKKTADWTWYSSLYTHSVRDALNSGPGMLQQHGWSTWGSNHRLFNHPLHLLSRSRPKHLKINII